MKKKIIKYFIELFIKLIPETRLFKLKNALYRYLGCEIGEGTEICSSAKIFNTGKITIGKNVWIGHEAIIACNENSSIVIEDNAKIGMRVVIVTGFHEVTPGGDCIEGIGTSSNIKIMKGSAISTMSIVLPGITVGSMSHAAAGSVITKDVESYVRVAGVPAKVIKRFT